MNSRLNPDTFLVSLTLSSRIKAENFSRNQSSTQKAQQVYKNTLAVLAVNTYLNYSGWVTSLKTSNSWNPIMQSLMDIGDLDLPEYGKVECRLIDSNAKYLVIPPEVREDRIAYIAVELKQSLESAIILGFMPEVTEDTILLSQLRSILELPAYLQNWKQEKELHKLLNPSITKLKQWLMGIVEENWQTIDEVFSLSPSLGLRNAQQLRSSLITKETLNEAVSRVKLLNLSPIERNKNIALILCIQEQQENLDISVKVCPTNSNTYLPKGLEVFILDEEEQPVMQAQANNTRTIEFRFSGESGEYFSIKACLDENTHVERFII